MLRYKSYIIEYKNDNMPADINKLGYDIHDQYSVSLWNGYLAIVNVDDFNKDAFDPKSMERNYRVRYLFPSRHNKKKMKSFDGIEVGTRAVHQSANLYSIMTKDDIKNGTLPKNAELFLCSDLEIIGLKIPLDKLTNTEYAKLGEYLRSNGYFKIDSDNRISESTIKMIFKQGGSYDRKKVFSSENRSINNIFFYPLMDKYREEAIRKNMKLEDLISKKASGVYYTENNKILNIIINKYKE